MIPADAPFILLEVAGPDLDPDGLTRRLGIAPTWASELPGPLAMWGSWALATRDQVRGNRLADHLRWLADRLGAGAEILHEDGVVGRARLLAQGVPDNWDRDVGVDEVQRARLGLPLSFVVFVKGETQIQVEHVEFRDP